jgi:transposase
LDGWLDVNDREFPDRRQRGSAPVLAHEVLGDWIRLMSAVHPWCDMPLDDVTGELWRGRIAPADRIGVRRFLGSLPAGRIDVAMEATTGWRFIVEEVVAAGARAHLAEPAETANLRGRKARAKTDRTDARHLRELLQQGRLPEAWAPPEEILELRQRVRLRKTLVDERTAWQQRIHALLFHHGIQRPRALLTRDGRALLAQLELSPSAREALNVALAMIDACETQLAPLDRELRRYAHRQAGCLAPTIQATSIERQQYALHRSLALKN